MAETQTNASPAPTATKDEQVGFHKGALTTLAKERTELVRLISIVEQLMGLHVKALKELGVDIEAEAKKALAEQKASKNLEAQV